jgi:hypothetical protein
MRELQDSYAKTMQPLGLERGLKGSVAKRTDIKKFYSLLNKELEKKLPEIKKGETIEKYKARAEAVYEATNLNYLNERLKAERKLVEVKTKYLPQARQESTEPCDSKYFRSSSTGGATSANILEKVYQQISNTD